MRVVFNVISYAIPSIGVALSLWATFRWDMPVPLALTVVSLAWAYGLFLVVLTVRTGSRDKKIEDVSLERGIVESIDHHSQDSIEIEIEIRIPVGNVRRRFTALKGTVGQLARGDSVLFAYMWQSKEIIRMATIDTSIPGRIILGSGQQRRGEPESTVKFARRILPIEELYNQAQFATFVPGSGGALATAALAGSVWGWPWAFLFLALAGIWVILFFVVANVEHSYKSVAKIKLDIGYVQAVEVKEGRQYFSEGPGSVVVTQSIVIADSAPPNGLNKRRHVTTDKTFAVHRGDLLILANDQNGSISKLRVEPTEEARETQRLILQHQAAEAAEAACAALRDIGVDSSVPDQDPFTAETVSRPWGNRPTWMGWVEIAEGPKRWVGQHPEADQPYQLYVPDSRIGPEFPEVAIRSEHLLEGGQTLEERLLLAASHDLARQEEARWVLSKHHPGPNEGFSLGVAEQLTNCGVLRENTIHLLISSDPDLGCWIFMRLPISDIRNEPVTKPFWDFCQAVAECLLAMPMPTSEQ